MLLFQLYTWLRHGEWVEFSVRTAVARFPLTPSGLQEWAGTVHQEYWTGVHVLLGWLPFSLTAAALAIACFLGAEE